MVNTNYGESKDTFPTLEELKSKSREKEEEYIQSITALVIRRIDLLLPQLVQIDGFREISIPETLDSNTLKT